MKHLAVAASALAVAASGAQAGGLDRSGTPIDIIFEQGNYAEVSLGFVDPDITGRDFAGNNVGNVGDDFTILGGGIKLDFGGPVSFALIYDEPYGSDVLWGGGRSATLLGGTKADAESNGLTALIKYQATDRISVYGGPRVASAEGEIVLGGLGFSAGAFAGTGPDLNGYTATFDSTTGVGAVVGAAYEIPKIAFRASLTWHSSIDINMRTTEAFPASFGNPALTGSGVTGPAATTGSTNVELPQTFKLAVQSGIAKNTLVFGSVRYAKWEDFSLIPPVLRIDLATLDSSITYEIGIGRRFTERLSGSISYTLDDSDGDDLVSPLAPTDGSQAISIGAKYKLTDMIDISGGIRYTWLGDATPEIGTPDTPLADFDNNDAISAGLKLGVHF